MAKITNGERYKTEKERYRQFWRELHMEGGEEMKDSVCNDCAKKMGYEPDDKSVGIWVATTGTRRR